MRERKAKINAVSKWNLFKVEQNNRKRKWLKFFNICWYEMNYFRAKQFAKLWLYIRDQTKHINNFKMPNKLQISL